MKTEKNADNSLREKIAATVIIWSSIALIAVALSTITFSYICNENPTENSKAIFNAFLPVVSTWVGTVIAFYFGRENFEAAGKQFNQIINKITPEMYKSVPVSQVMIDLDTMMKMTGASLKTTTLGNLTSQLTNTTRTRLPILDDDCKPLYMMHKMEYDRLVKDTANLPKTLESFAKYGFQQEMGFVIVPETATLQDAQKAVAVIPNCKDVFITKTGTPDEPLLGWLTDSRILNFLK